MNAPGREGAVAIERGLASVRVGYCRRLDSERIAARRCRSPISRPNVPDLQSDALLGEAGAVLSTELAPCERFEPQDEGGYHVYAPGLPGLHTQGDTLDEAIANAEEALELYVEGLASAEATFA